MKNAKHLLPWFISSLIISAFTLCMSSCGPIHTYGGIEADHYWSPDGYHGESHHRPQKHKKHKKHKKHHRHDDGMAMIYSGDDVAYICTYAMSDSLTTTALLWDSSCDE